MICLWHSDTGVPFNQSTEGNEELAQKVGEVATEQETVLLSPGMYHLTSGFANGSFFEHKLMVRSDGRGLISILPIRFRKVQVGNKPLFIPEDIGERRSVSSNPGHLLFTGILPAQILPQIVKRLFQPDLFTSYGIRTLSEHDPDFDSQSYHLGSVWPHDNWIIYYGLQQQGFKKEAELLKQGFLKTHKELGFIPELFGVKNGKAFSLSAGSRQSSSVIPANNIQAWAICGLLQMIWED